MDEWLRPTRNEADKEAWLDRLEERVCDRTTTEQPMDTHNDDLIWTGTIDDGTWQMDVRRVSPRTGMVVVTNLTTGERILGEDVPLAYDAMFGPDRDDLVMWQTMAIEAVDHHNAQHPVEDEIRRRLGEQS